MVRQDAYTSAQEALKIWQEVVDQSFNNNELNKKLGKDVVELKKAAQEFLTYMIDKEKGYLVVQEHIKHVRNLRKGKAPSEYESIDGYIKANAAMHELFESNGRGIYEQVVKFQEKLNSILGQKVQMIYVFEDDEGNPFLYEITENELLNHLKYDYTRTAMTGRINFSESQLTAMKNVVDDSIHTDINLIKSTYKEVMNRYRISKLSKNKYIDYEYPPGTYNRLTISTEGDINEAYAAILLNRQSKTIFTSNNMEQNIAQYAQYIKQVDNVSGLLEGDITAGETEYAIKSAQAGMLGVSQMINMAKNILKDIKFDTQSLKEEKQKLHDRGKGRNIETIIKKIDKEVDETIDPIRRFDTKSGTWQD